MNTNENLTPPANRLLTMSSKHFLRGAGIHRRYYVHFPALLLAGKWLQDCGFKAGDQVNVSFEAGRLIITLSADEGG